MTSADTLRNVTQIQRSASSVPLDLCDGHARHTLSRPTRAALSETVAETFDGDHPDIEAVERRFLASLSAQTGQPYDRYPCYLFYSASVAIDVVAKYLGLTRRRTGVIHPALDCIPFLLRRGGTDTVPVPESRLMSMPDIDFLDSLQLDALFLVTPNNPTGVGLAAAGLRRLFQWAAERGIALVLDLSFRLLDDSVQGDLLRVAETMGTQLITVDDTGKTLPLFGTKVGVLASTFALGGELGRLHSELLLNVSSLELRLLTTVLDTARSAPGEVGAARELVRANRSYLRSVLSDVDPLDRFASRFSADVDSCMSVEWVRVGERQPEIVRACRDDGLAVLPGDSFSWAADADADADGGWKYIRLALLRDAEPFRKGADILAKVIANDQPIWEER